MLPKKFLSLTLATGLAVSASSNVFALGGQSDVAPSPSATQCSTEIMSNITTLLAIRACVIKLSNIIETITSPEVQAFCQQLKYTQDVNKLAAEFERLYNSEPEFAKAVDEAWVTDATGSKKHASIQGNGISSTQQSTDKNVKRNTGIFWGIESKNNTANKHVKRNTWIGWAIKPNKTIPVRRRSRKYYTGFHDSLCKETRIRKHTTWEGY